MITVNVRETKDLFPFAEVGLAVGIYDAKDIASSIRAILERGGIRQKLAERRRELLPQYSFAEDGQASSRVARLIEEMAEAKD